MSKRMFWGLMGVIMVMGGLIRFWGLATTPPSLDWDEVSMGYNAYSILKTGRDEFGKFLPVYLRALDDDKLPGYTYLTVGSIGLWGYNDWAVRFPSAFLGTLTVVLVGILSYLLFGDRWIAVLAAGLMAVLPWHVQFSRMASEVNVGLFWLVLATVLLLRGRPILAVISFGLAGYTYLSYRVIAPLLGLGLAWRARRWWVAGAMIGLLIVGLGRGHVRMKGTSVFGTEEAYQMFKHQEREMFYDATLKINLTRRLFHDAKSPTAATMMIKGYLSHFAPAFLFFDYDEKQHQTPFVGLNYLWMLPFLVLGAYYLVAKGKRLGAGIIWLWLLLAPLPAAVTRGVPHAGRTEAMTVPLMIIAALGMRFGLKRWWLKLGVGVWAGLSLIHFGHQYWVHLPHERSVAWQYGRKEMTEYLVKHKDEYDRVVVSTKLEWPYIFMLYYSKYDPAAYLAQGGTRSGGWGEEGNRYDVYAFHRFRPEDLHDSKALLAGTPDELIGKAVPMEVIRYRNGDPAIVIGKGRAGTQ